MPETPPPQKDQTIQFTEIQARAKPRDDGFSVDRVKPFLSECRHWKITVDEEKGTVECQTCKAPLNPIWVLVRYATEESRLMQRLKAVRAESAALAEKKKVKCGHCGRFTNLR